MKKIKIEKKLSLSKETIAKLNNDQLSTIKGGTKLTRNDCPTGQASITTCTISGTGC
ncbi:MAG TPA: class I lanthipeptide [Bacteroidia bacterium]|jgi:natural product precursor|nr:class I lanthipeptide [Bacteroidia bacterium]HRG52256.1 class I lanthipeptide [Bacteroidia bacterium]